MNTQDPSPPDRWDEAGSQAFIDYGRYFVPQREHQIQIIVDLLPEDDQPYASIDLCCGEGQLAEAILAQHSAPHVYGLDGSPQMLAKATERLARFGERFKSRPFDLFERDWPEMSLPLRAVVSSLAIHHLDGSGKQTLFREIHALLAPGGILAIADLVEPAQPAGWAVAAKAWDQAVQERSMELDGTLEGFAAFDRLRWNMYRYFDPEDIDKPSRLFDQLKWLEAAGFEAVDVYWMYAGHAIFTGIKTVSG
jgi:tRNA (cmo5U34)-methyltransferase